LADGFRAAGILPASPGWLSDGSTGAYHKKRRRSRTSRKRSGYSSAAVCASATALLRSLIDCTHRRNRTSMGIPLVTSGRRLTGERGRMKLSANCSPVTGCERRALLQLDRCAATQEVAGASQDVVGTSVWERIEAASNVALELVGWNDLRRLKECRRVGTGYPHNIERRLALFPYLPMLGSNRVGPP
jgi:hypothetical protein